MRLILLLCGVIAAFTGYSTTYIVDSEEMFHDVQEEAAAGDSIIWESGEYVHVELDIDRDSLYISAMELGATIFTGTSAVDISGDHIVFRGFQFVEGDVGNGDIVNITGSHILFTEINIRAFESFKYLRVRESSQYVTISYCNFENRINLDDQNILSILVSNNQPGYHKIQYCSFKNFDGGGRDDGIEPIRIGLSTQADRISRTLVEYCYFTQCNGDGEIISSKASQNVYRYNTFDDNPLAELVLRHGSEAIVYGNFFLNGMGGVRVREGQQHYIYNNYFENLQQRAIFLQNDDSDRLDDINIAFNTIVNCGEVRLGRGADEPTNVTFANNIFADPKDSNLFQDATGTEQWFANIALGSLGFTMPTGLTEEDPLLTQNSLGFFVLDAASPAIDAAQDGFKALPQFEGMDAIDTALELDIMQQTRPTDIAMRDIGCTEYPSIDTLQPYATEDNTGPHYDTDVSTSVTEVNRTSQPWQTRVYPSPAVDQVTVEVVAEEVVDLSLRVYDGQGRVVRTLPTWRQMVGSTSRVIPLVDLPSGTYLLRLESSQHGRVSGSETIQVIKI